MFARIEKALQENERLRLTGDGLTPAAVLVPLFKKEDELHLLMGLRTDRVLKHKRQVSFPGGTCDPEDKDVVATALREAWEEVGLDPKDVEVLGLQGDIQTFTGFLVTPVVGRIPYPYPFRLSEDEVEQLLEVPWSVFSEGRGHRQECMEYEGKEHVVDFYDFEDQIIWGATARITRQLVKMVEDRNRAPREAK
jgi:8-oxo-dGTP pyrophosphatase MutT (NUDIX family)